MIRKTTVAILLGTCAMALSFSAQVYAHDHNGKEAKVLVVGLDDHFPPMGFRDDDNKIVGFDIDLARAVVKRMGDTPEFKPIDWSTKEMELISKRVDLLWNGLTLTDERRQKIDFSAPYMENHQIIVVPAKSKIETKADLKGKTVAVQNASSAVDAVEKEPEVLKSFKEFKKYGDNVAALLDLEVGRVDALVLDEVVGRYYISKKSGKFRVLTDNFGTEEYGVGLRKDDKVLKEKLLKAFDEVKQDGTAGKISVRWFGKDIIK